MRRILHLRSAFEPRYAVRICERGGECPMTMVTVYADIDTTRERVMRKCHESMEMKEKFFDQYADQLGIMAEEMAERFRHGSRMYTMGNGGSLCDALHLAVEFNHPIIEKRKAFPVIPLMTDISTVTAISNDLDYTRVYVNQIKLHGRAGD